MSPSSARTGAICCLFFFVFGLTGQAAQPQQKTPFGIAWNVSGTWQVQGMSHPLLNGDAVFPGSLLQPSSENFRHAITILLPDGQSVAYQCYRAADCMRGFRVPELYRKPQLFANAMLMRVYAVLMRESAAERASWSEDPSLGQDEAVSVLSQDHSVEVGGLAATMSNGHYSCEITEAGTGRAASRRVEIDKRASSIRLVLPGPGLYHAKFYDQFSNPRVDLLIAAVDAVRAKEVTGPYQNLNSLLAVWNEDLLSWPAHALRRLYLESLMFHITPQAPAAPPRNENVQRVDTTAEPTFSPRPGLFHGEFEIKLQCTTPGATIYYTLDGAPPFKHSTVYRGPVISKGADLTVKAFASAPGKKDSPVVTGTFQVDAE